MLLTGTTAPVIFRSNGKHAAKIRVAAARGPIRVWVLAGFSRHDAGRASTRLSGELVRYYEAMSGALGPMHWWPAKTPFEVIVGAILTQSTSWGNVERAIGNLRSAQMLTPPGHPEGAISRLAALVRPSGYFRQKAKKLKAFVQFLQNEYGGSLKRMFQTPTPSCAKSSCRSMESARKQRTPSCCTLEITPYSWWMPTRIGFSRATESRTASRTTKRSARYSKRHFPASPQLWNEFHALIVNTGKNWCRKSVPRCRECPLRSLLPATSPLLKFISAPRELPTTTKASA